MKTIEEFTHQKEGKNVTLVKLFFNIQDIKSQSYVVIIETAWVQLWSGSVIFDRFLSIKFLSITKNLVNTKLLVVGKLQQVVNF